MIILLSTDNYIHYQHIYKIMLPARLLTGFASRSSMPLVFRT